MNAPGRGLVRFFAAAALAFSSRPAPLAGAQGAPAAVSPAAHAGSAVRAAPAALSRGAGGLLAAICYHRFGAETAKDPYRISLPRLGGELRWLRSNGWRGVSLTQVAAALDGDAAALPPKAILLTVDDGYKVGALAAPTFARYGYRAVYFVVPGVLGRGAFFSYADLKSLEARGFEIGSHTLTHPDLAKVPRGLDPPGYAAWVRRELGEPKRLLEAALGHPVTALAWPYGAYNPALAGAALRLGYRQLWSVSGGLNDQSHLDRASLRRLIIMGHPSLAEFARRVGKLPLTPYAGGVAEGSLIYRSSLPLRVLIPKGDQAVLGGKPVVLGAGHAFWLGRQMHGGFHYLNVAEEDGKGNRLTPFLFQVAPDAWKPCFDALDSVGAAPTPLSGSSAAGAAGAPTPQDRLHDEDGHGR